MAMSETIKKLLEAAEQNFLNAARLIAVVYGYIEAQQAAQFIGGADDGE